MLPLLGLLGPIIGKVVGTVGSVIDQVVEDKDLANQLKAKAAEAARDIDHKEFTVEIKEVSKIIRAEANSQSWIARNWRPLIMLLFGAIIANNYIIFPYMNMFMPEKSVLLPVPLDLWALLKIGLGGYVVGRSVEKVVGIIKK